MESNPPKLNPKPTWLEIAIGFALFVGISMVVVPQFSRAAGEGRLAQLSDTLYLVRCAIDLYQADHEGLLPGQAKAGQPVRPEFFVRDLTSPGPAGASAYLRPFPGNPFISQDDRRNTITCVHDPNMMPNGTEGTAWWFNSATGDFRACDNQFHTVY
ncbi:MAG TPA: hypothetical protein PKB02_08235 [Anaerohalosphaeraceae bacterium]|nr:hypothetical protein [Anaerohalosphaeraceae bacterium]